MSEKVLVSEINGVKIIKETRKDYVLAVCKYCKKEWETNLYTLPNKKSCGCSSWKQLKPLPEYINGFKTIKCHGYNKEKGYRWATVECKECKREYEVDPNKLKYRKHCGCLKKGIVASKCKKEYPKMVESYKHMKQRCYNKNDKDYHNYGARGIKICEEWLNDRNYFYEWALMNGYVDGLTIDRINNDLGYSPENCRWVPMCEQGKNTRRVKRTYWINKE